MKSTIFLSSGKMTLVLSLLLLIVAPTSLFAQFNYVETKNMKLVYASSAQAFLVPYSIQCYENSLRFHSKLWNFYPYEKPTIILHDLSDYGNAGASTIPRNRITVAIAPLNYAYETAPANERINSIMNHELVHIVVGDQYSGKDKFFRRLFSGKVSASTDNPLTIIYEYLTSPRRSAPYWYHEGIAVFFETWMAGGYGRALGSYDEMVFRTLVKDSGHFYDLVGLESEGTKVDFLVGVNSYLYGTRFMSYLALQYGPETLVEWINHVSGTSAYFGSQFKKVYGISMDDAWDNWIEWEKIFQEENLGRIRFYPTTKYRSIASKGLGSASRAFYDKKTNSLLTAIYYPGRPAHIASISLDDGSIKNYGDVKGPALFYVTSLAYDSSTGNIFYTIDNNDWRDIVIYNIHTKKSRTVLKDARVGDLVFNKSDSSLWGVRHFNAISTVVRIPYPYEEWNQIYSWPFGRDMYDLDISADGKKLAGSLSEVSGRQTLISMEIESLMNGDTSFVTLFDFGNSIPMNFIFTEDGNYLYGSSYYTGVSNLFRYDFARDSMEAVTNCEAGMFRPISTGDDSLVVFHYTAKGFMPVKIKDTILEDVSAITFLGQEVVKKHPIVTEWNVGSPATIDLDTMIIDSGKYNSLSNMSISSMFPIVEGYKDYAAYGMKINFAELIGFRKSHLTVSYSLDKELEKSERLHLDWGYNYLAWDLSANYNSADFYDLFGPTKTSRKGYSVSLGYKRTLFERLPKKMNYSLRATWYGNLQKLPDYQNIDASFDRFFSFTAKIGYSNIKGSIGAVDYEKGVKWELISNTKVVNSVRYPHLIQNLDLGIPLPVYHSSLWIRTTLGYSDGKRDVPFANFYFGGFGNNWVDHSSIKRFRKYYSFPGLELNQLSAKNFAKLTTELNLPPLRFRRLGTSSFYFSWLRMSAFASGIKTNLDDKQFEERAFSVGVQADLRIVLLSHLRFTLSAGYAEAYDENFNYFSDEYMVSLKVL